MNSALYHGWVSHRRFSPRAHAFRYRIGMLYLDLDEQEQVLGLSPLAGHSRFAPFAFRESDYLPAHTGHGERLIDAVRERVEAAIGHRPQGRVCLLTQPRSWGLAFNPLSVFFCHEADGRLAAILCEVSNTPWRERYHYVLPVGPDTDTDTGTGTGTGTGELRHRVPKSFHVSPFLPRELEYRMRVTRPGERLRIHMADWQGEEKLFEAGLGLRRQPLDRASLHRHLLVFPWMTGKTVLGIYWQALRLLLKRTPIFDHQPADGDQRTARQESTHEKP